MKLSFIVILFFSSFILSISQTNEINPLVAYQMEDGWHILDNSGKEMFPTKNLSDVSGFSDGLFCVEGEIKGKKQWAYMDMKGDIVITPGTEEISLFSDGRAAVYNYTKKETDEKMVGFINKKGEFITPIKYLDAISFSEGLAYVMNNNERGYIDTNGKIRLRLLDKVGYRFSEGVAALSTNDFKVGYIDINGKLILGYNYDEPNAFKGGVTTVLDRGKFGCINKKGEFVIPALYDEIKSFYEERAFVAKNVADPTKFLRDKSEINNDDKSKPNSQFWAVMDINGNLLTMYLYDQCRDFSNGLACVKIDNKWGFINRSGNFAFSTNFTYADSFGKDGLAFASNSEKKVAGFIGKDGEFKINIPTNCKKIVDLRLNKVVFY